MVISHSFSLQYYFDAMKYISEIKDSLTGKSVLQYRECPIKSTIERFPVKSLDYQTTLQRRNQKEHFKL